MNAEDQAALLARVDERTRHMADDLSVVTKDHETRIRALEKWWWRTAAPSGLLGFGGGLIGAWLRLKGGA